MLKWLQQLKFDPIPILVKTRIEALVYFVKRDLLEESVESAKTLWNLQEFTKIVSKQQEDGSWKYHGGKVDIRSQENYDQLETYRVLGILVEKYGLNKENVAVQGAADFLFRFQTREGDFRGIYGNQYTPNYSAAIMELLIKAGYDKDSRIEEGFSWLLSIRQNDGGWAIPFRTTERKDSGTILRAMKNEEPSKPDKTKPFSHCITGVVLRTFAAHGKYCKAKEAKMAGELLKSRFFRPDKYPDRKAASFWTRFSYPFWFTDLLSSLDSLSLLGFTHEDSHVKEALEWLRDRQQENGLWKVMLLRTKDKELIFWVSLAICRVFKRFYTTT